MDQEQDTIGNPNSSPNTYPRRKIAPSARRPAASPTAGQPQSVKMPDPTENSVHGGTAARPQAELPPVLFQLPDKTPETLQQQSDPHQIAIHRRHESPPAAHVDQPPGNGGFIGRPGPDAPSGVDSIRPLEPQSQFPSAPRQPLTPQERHGDQPGDQLGERPDLAATGGSTASTWSQLAAESWVTRSLLVMLMSFLLTLAFLYGRGFNSDNGGSAEPMISENHPAADQDSVASGLSMIADDIDVFDKDDLLRSGSAHLKNAESELQKLIDESVAESARPNPSPSFAAGQHTGQTKVPSYIAESPRHSADGPLGRPSAPPQPAGDSPSPYASNPYVANPYPPAGNASGESAHQHGLPAEFAPQGSLTGYRPDPNRDPVAPAYSAPPLRSGEVRPATEDRLPPGDSNRQTETPHPIGNFLNILHQWESTNPNQQ